MKRQQLLLYKRPLRSTLEKLGTFSMIRKDIQGFLHFLDHGIFFPPKEHLLTFYKTSVLHGRQVGK